MRERDGPAGEWQAAARARLDDFLEDRWTIGLGVTHQQQRRSAIAFTSVDARSRGTRLELSLSYGQGRFEAPGLIEPVLPLN